MHQKPQKKILLLASVKNPKQNKDFFSFWQTPSLKSKSLTQSPIILSGCKRNASNNCALSSTLIGQKPYSTFKSTPHWLKRRSARPSSHAIAHLKGGTEVLDPLNSLIMAGDICWAKQWTIFGTKMLIYKLRNT